MLTGGTGYIGSHCAVELIKNGYDVVIIDDLQNSNAEVFDRIHQVVGLDQDSTRLNIFEISMLDLAALKIAFADASPLHSVLHLAGLKSVNESVLNPMKYYKNNLISTINLIECMLEFEVDKLVFSSSATVYGQPQALPIAEDHPVGQNIPNTYGKTKYMIETMLNDWVNSIKLLLERDVAVTPVSVSILRYFNPVGADPSGLVGECPAGVPANLMPYVSQVAAGIRPHVNVYGKDYDTPDGTGVRDYIHVTDLAVGHIAALKHMPKGPSMSVYNLGTGKGYSVLEMINAMEKASGKKIPYEIKERRPGDLACVYCDPSKAERELDWKAKKSLEDMCKDLWRWQTMNPHGYLDSTRTEE